MRTLGSWFGIVGVCVLAACTSIPDSLCGYENLCVATGDGGSDSASDTGVDAPQGCDLTKDPKDSPLCIADTVGIFVDATKGDDSGGDGSKAKPVKTISKALSILGGKPRVYVCEGTYAGSVDVASAAAIYGGLTCSWAPGGARPVIQADKPAYGIRIASSKVSLTDLEVASKDGAAPGESSVGIFAVTANGLTMTRIKVTAGAGQPGTAGVTGSNYTAVAQGDPSIKGNGASGVAGGGLKVCALCTDAKNSVGGGGGTGGAAPGDGSDGTPNLGGITPVDGKGGLKDTGSACSNGHKGTTATSSPAATSVTTLGTVDGVGWKASSGAGALNGGPAQGGGGGGGGIDGSNTSGGGGGGGCGGCGGAGGPGGGGGGASLAVVVVDTTTATITDCELATKGWKWVYIR